MSSLDLLFSSVVLHVSVPDTSLDFPLPAQGDEWLQRLNSVERKSAFFDEQLLSLLTIRIVHPSQDATDPQRPPHEVLLLLAHTQVSFEATYISSVPINKTPTRLSGPPRTSSLLVKGSPRPPSHHPSIFPPATPNPTPASADKDRKYATSEGALLLASIWGSNMSENSPEAFALFWSEEEKLWVAVYRLGFTISYLRVDYHDPLLCLTVSATLREKPVVGNAPFAKYLSSIGENNVITPDLPQQEENFKEPEQDIFTGFVEVNLLEGLFAGPTFGRTDTQSMIFPSTRIGNESRKELFSLAPVTPISPDAPSPSPLTVVRKSHPTLRKSYRKTLQTMSGFKVRMRTVFVPYVLFSNSKDEDYAGDQEAGSEERTVVLCVELEDSGDSGEGVGYEVEKIIVNISGNGARTTLIGWGNNSFSPDAAEGTFPLKIGPYSQFNLLYAVTFLRSPEETDAFSSARGHSVSQDLQRAVTINIFGKPYIPSSAESGSLLYPTNTFSSRWNCVLDLSAKQNHTLDNSYENDTVQSFPNVLPEPASPFPVFSLRNAHINTGSPITASGSVAVPHSAAPFTQHAINNKRFTLPADGHFAGTPTVRPSPNRTSNPVPNAASSLNTARMSGNLPSPLQHLRTPTTYSAPPPPPASQTNHYPTPSEIDDGHVPAFDTPITPAYPAFPPRSNFPSTPISIGPITSHAQSSVGPSVDIRRQRGAAGSVPPTPGPLIPGAFNDQRGLPNLGEAGESVVVSVGLLPVIGHDGEDKGRIYPFDTFTLDIFVFNQSTWPRRFEVTCPKKRRNKRTEGEPEQSGSAAKIGYPGVLPLDSRVRIGPLRPSSCQSVRMNFLAISHGVHLIDTLTLTDIETGISTNLRSVLDVVVHDPND